MRIISGNLKGASLFYSKNKTTRPLKDLARESIFNLLIHSNKFPFQFEKKNILDLYAGTGSFGLECISRNCKEANFVEKNKDATRILEKNIDKLNVQNRTKIFLSDVFDFLKDQKFSLLKYDLIFCDPPFANTNINNLIELILKKNILKKDGIIILHRNKVDKEVFSIKFKILEERVYGLSKIVFGKF